MTCYMYGVYDDELLEFHVTGPTTLGYAYVDTVWQ